MAPNRGSSSKGKASSSSSSGPKKGVLSSGSRVSKPGGGGGSKKRNVKRPPPQEMKSKARTAPDQLKRKKKREYTEAELDLPKLNTITPVGVVKPKGKKKGKTFVDDQVRCCDDSLLLNWLVQEMLTRRNFGCLGSHDDHPCNGKCRERRPDRVEDHEGSTIGGNSGSEAERSRSATGGEEVEIRTLSKFPGLELFLVVE